jgi:hypothetical protein
MKLGWQQAHLLDLRISRPIFLLSGTLAVLLGAGTASAAGPWSRFGLEIEGGSLWTTRNDVKIPPGTGTKFSLQDLTGKGAGPYFRGYASVNFNRKHGIRLLAAPLEISGTGPLNQPVSFAGQNFAAGKDTEGVFKFNTYRVTYRYTFHEGDRWRLQVGAAGLVRDAKIELRQAGVTARDTDLGLVPLAYFSARYRLTDKASVLFDFEGLGAKQGRALDGILKVDYDLGKGVTLGAGYRTLEGGADVERVYTFAWLHYAAVSLGYRF